jgi:hypothetical protein
VSSDVGYGRAGLVGSRDNATDSGNVASMTLQKIIKIGGVRRLYAEKDMAGTVATTDIFSCDANV